MEVVNSCVQLETIRWDQLNLWYVHLLSDLNYQKINPSFINFSVLSCHDRSIFTDSSL